MSSRIVVWSFSALLAIFSGGFGRLAANPSANLTGVVYSEASNQRIGHASVWLCDSGGNRLQESVTTDTGEFAFVGLRAGDYVLKASAPGYTAIELNVEVNFATERGISIFMKPTGMAASQGKSGLLVSAHELSMPKSARKLADTGKRKLYSEKKPENALKYLESAVAKAPDYYEAYYHLGMTYLALQNTADAEKRLQKSVELSAETYADADLALAALWLSRKDTMRGEPLLRKGLELNPNSWAGFFELGKLELYRNNYEAALQAAERAQKLGPDQPLAYRLLSLVHLRQNNYAAALADLEAYIRLDPNTADGQHAKEIRADLQKRLAAQHSIANATPVIN